MGIWLGERRDRWEAGRADGLFEGAARAEQTDAIECEFVDRGRLIELAAATSDVSEGGRGRKKVGLKRDGLGHRRGGLS
jgi:hypothetical protein